MKLWVDSLVVCSREHALVQLRHSCQTWSQIPTTTLLLELRIQLNVVISNSLPLVSSWVAQTVRLTTTSTTLTKTMVLVFTLRFL